MSGFILFLSQLEFSRDDVMKELTFLEAEFKAEDQEIALCHGDVWWANMLYNKDKGTHIDIHIHTLTVN